MKYGSTNGIRRLVRPPDAIRVKIRGRIIPDNLYKLTFSCLFRNRRRY